MNIWRILEARRSGAVDPFRSAMYFGGKDSPDPPDYKAAAAEQAQASKEITNMQTFANRPTVNTPFGTQTWDTSKQIDLATGQEVTGWTQNINLTPEMQSSLDAQQRISSGRSNAAETLLGQATGAFQKPMDWDGLPQAFSFNNNAGQMKTSLPGGSDYRDKAQEAVWQRMQPELQQRRNSTETQLSNMGLTRGSEAWNNEARRLDEGENTARLQAIDSGRAEAAQQFGQDVTSSNFTNSALAQQQGQNMQYGNYQGTQRQQAIGEEQARRGQSLNELNALLTGQQVGMPSFPSFNTASKSETPQVMQAAQLGYQGQLDQYNSQQAGLSGMLSGATGLAGAFMTGGASIPFGLG